MPPSDESEEIVHAFSKYAKTGDEKLIENIPLKKIEIALLQYLADKDYSHYSAMEKRVEELKEENKFKRDNAEKWKDRVISFVLGILDATHRSFARRRRHEDARCVGHARAHTCAWTAGSRGGGWKTCLFYIFRKEN